MKSDTREEKILEKDNEDLRKRKPVQQEVGSVWDIMGPDERENTN